MPCRRTDLFFQPLQPRSSRYFFAVANLFAHAALYGALRHSLRAPPHPSVPPLNLHRARIRRNRRRLPSSRCIESTQTPRARACALPARASDTTLGLIVTRVIGIHWRVATARQIRRTLHESEKKSNVWQEWWVLCISASGSKRSGTPSKQFRVGTDICWRRRPILPLP